MQTGHEIRSSTDFKSRRTQTFFLFNNGRTKIVLVESSYCNPFRLQSFCQHGSGRVYPECLIRHLTSFGPPVQIDRKNRSGTDGKLRANEAAELGRTVGLRLFVGAAAACWPHQCRGRCVCVCIYRVCLTAVLVTLFQTPASMASFCVFIESRLARPDTLDAPVWNFPTRLDIAFGCTFDAA